jgi:hypothetical protein
MMIEPDQGELAWARDLDRDNLLWCEFCRPVKIETGSKEDLAIQLAMPGNRFADLFSAGHVIDYSV